MLDKNFIGIIVSVFNQNKQTLTDSIEVIAFQSDEKTVNKGFIQIPIEICVSDEVFIEKNLQTLYKIPQILVQEEENAYKAHMSGNENLLCLMSNIGSKLKILDLNTTINNSKSSFCLLNSSFAFDESTYRHIILGNHRCTQMSP